MKTKTLNMMTKKCEENKKEKSNKNDKKKYRKELKNEK